MTAIEKVEANKASVWTILLAFIGGAVGGAIPGALALARMEAVLENHVKDNNVHLVSGDTRFASRDVLDQKFSEISRRIDESRSIQTQQYADIKASVDRNFSLIWQVITAKEKKD